MTDLSNYLTRKQFADELGIGVATLRKREESVAGTEYELSDGVKFGNMTIYPRDSWEKMNGGRLVPAIDEAVRLGLVIRISDHTDAMDEHWEAAYALGKADGIASIASELPEDGSEDLEILEAATPVGLTHGGFQPLSSMGL